MNRLLLCSVIALSVAGCDQHDAKICADTEPLLVGDYSPPQKSESGLPKLTSKPSPVVANTKNAATICLKEWGWKLAKSQGSNEELADAVMQACQSQIAAVIALPHFVFDLGDGGVEGEAKYQTQIIGDHRKKALFRVIQGRSGHCKFN